jgi:sacsin
LSELYKRGREGGPTESLTKRLKGLIRGYPEGVGILKELIQNADDAGASKVIFTIDWRTRSAKALPDPRMAELLGPALLAFNDQPFTDADFEGIRRLGDSVKADDVKKTGRFGVGFNSVYNVTDWPSFVSTEWIEFIDPHCNVIPHATNHAPGHGWKFSEEAWWTDFPDLMAAYVAGGLEPGTSNFSGTLFRLPFRSEAQAKRSDIKKRPFGRKNIERIVKELEDVGDEILIFLKSVQSIEVREILEGEASPRTILSIRSINEREVGKARRSLLSILSGKQDAFVRKLRSQANELPGVSYLHEIVCNHRGSESRSTWRVVSLFHLDEEGELLNAVEELTKLGEKALPLVGAAARVRSSKKTTFKGRAYCFLPTPVKTGLPFHVNGFFDLDSNRTGLTSEDELGVDEEYRGIWNRLLIERGIGEACARLLVDLTLDLGHKRIKEFYELWPLSVANAAFDGLPDSVLHAIADREVIRTSACWSSPKDVWVLPDQWVQLSEPLIADGVLLPVPALPEEIVAAFEAADAALDVFSSGNLRELLKRTEKLGVALTDAPSQSLRRREWVVELLRYCLADGTNELLGLPLAILENGNLDVFGYSASGSLFLADASQIALFPTRKHWFIERKFAQEVSLGAVPGAKLSVMSPEQVVLNLKTYVGDEAPKSWKPASQDPPNASWLAQVFTYFKKCSQVPTDEFNKLPLVPGSDGQLHQGGFPSTPLLGGAIPPKLEGVLKRFGVPLVKGPEELVEAIGSFADAHTDTVVWKLTGPDLVDTLVELSTEGFPPFDAKQYAAIVDFLADPQWNYDEARKTKLKGLLLFATTSGEPIDLTTGKIYMPGSYDAPKLPHEACLLETRGSDRLQTFYSKLGIPTLSRSRLISELLLPTFEGMSSKDQKVSLSWLRKNLAAAQDELESEGQEPSKLIARIGKVALVPCRDGKHRLPCDVYDPEAKAALAVLGGHAPLPDVNWCEGDAGRWLEFFRSIGLRQTVSGQDLLNYVDRLCKQGAESVSQALLDVLDHLGQFWEQLKDEVVSGNETLFNALKQRSWLPALTSPKELANYPIAQTPQPRFFKPAELYPQNLGHQMASQAPLLPGRTPKGQVLHALGFPAFVPLPMLLAHFKALISHCENVGPDNVPVEINKTLATIYGDLGRRLKQTPQTSFPASTLGTSDEQSLIRASLRGLACLWDAERRRFYRPEHTFLMPVPYFGQRRTSARPPGALGETYDLLGRRPSPDVQDVKDFLDEIAIETEGDALTEADLERILATFEFLARNFPSRDEYDGNDLLVLTEDGRLALASEVYQFDADWWTDHIAPNVVNIVHHRIWPLLADAMGCLSLADSIIEAPKGIPELSTEKQVNAWCQSWQHVLNSREFIRALDRLVRHATKMPLDGDWQWLAKAQIVPATRILMDLVLKGRVVAGGIEGDHYHAAAERVVYIRCDDKRTMLHYLVSVLARSIGPEASAIRSELEMVLELAPTEISRALDKRRIKALRDAPSYVEGDGSDSDLGDVHWADFEVPGEGEQTANPPDESNDPDEDALPGPAGQNHSDRPKWQLPSKTDNGRESDTSKDTVASAGGGTVPSVGGVKPTQQSEDDEDGDGAPQQDHGAKPGSRGIAPLPEEHGPSAPLPLTQSQHPKRWRQSGQDKSPADASQRRDATEASGDSSTAKEAPVSSDEASHSLPECHQSYDKEIFSRTPIVPIDVNGLLEKFENAAIEPWNEQKGASGRSQTSPGYSGPLAPVNEGTAVILASSLETGLLWLRQPKPAALFPPDEAEFQSKGGFFWANLLDDEPGGNRFKLFVDYEREVVFPDGAGCDRLVDFFYGHDLLPGCQLTITRLENGGYRIGYVAEEHEVSSLPIIGLDANGKPVVRLLTEKRVLPCRYDYRLLLGEQRFVDDEARSALAQMAASAPDIFHAIIGLLEGRREPIDIKHLYLLNFQIRPVSFNYFHSVIKRNAGPDLPFNLNGDLVSANDPSDVQRVHVPRRTRTWRTGHYVNIGERSNRNGTVSSRMGVSSFEPSEDTPFEEPNWQALRDGISQVLTRSAAQQPEALIEAILGFVRLWLSEHLSIHLADRETI